MALSKDKKNQVVDEVSELLTNSKMTVIATYQGTPVKAMQQLRREGRDNSTTVKVIKNRLVKKALESDDKFKSIDPSVLTGMLAYAFSQTDEVAPAQTLANFAKTQPTLVFVGGISAEGKFLDADEVKALAALPGKNELIAQVFATLTSPLNDALGGLSGNLHALLDGIKGQATA